MTNRKPKRMRLKAAKKAGFSAAAMRKQKELQKQTLGYMKQKSSFLVAAFSLAAFITGNMVGQHGWYAFWKAALGQYDDSLIEYTGTVPPVALVPDYTRWSHYGGNGEEHTFKQVPKDVLIPLPLYHSHDQKHDFDHSEPGDVYSIGFMGSYETGAEGDGSHIGVDIRIPQGTPIQSIANGIVTRVANDTYGFGKLVVVRHPHMPDPENPKGKTTVLYSSYAHLSAQYVEEGQIVRKGEVLGLSGKTGFATGPHLHFQIDTEDSPWQPYWPFSYSEARAVGMNTAQAINAGLNQERGYEYSVNPLLYIQANYPAVSNGTTIASRAEVRKAERLSLREAVADRRAQRMAARGIATVTYQPSSTTTVQTPVTAKEESTTIAKQTTVADTSVAQSTEPAPIIAPTLSAAEVAAVSFDHARTFSEREWITVRITLLDAFGKKTTAQGLERDLYLRTEYGDAEFDPPVLRKADFEAGVATVKMLPRGRRTVVITAKPLQSMSDPIQYKD